MHGQQNIKIYEDKECSVEFGLRSLFYLGEKFGFLRLLCGAVLC